MDNDIIINLHGDPALNFSTIYQFAYLVPFILLLIIGIKRKYDMLRWIAILLATSFFFLLGTRITTFSLHDWRVIFSEGSWPGHYHKFALGGVLVALLGLTLTRRFLNFRDPVLSIYAWVAPLGLALQKPGCLLSGCCFGVPTQGSWGIAYAEGNPAYNVQLIEGLIAAGDPASLPVHPVQLYQVVVYLAITAIVLLSGNFLQKKRSTVILALALLFLTRFLLEFIIDPAATQTGGQIVLGMKILQWELLAGTILAVLALIRSEKRPEEAESKSSGHRSVTYRPVFLFVLFACGMVALKHAFSYNELFAFNTRFIVLTIIFMVILFKRITRPGLRWSSLLILLLPLLLTSQTLGPGQEGNIRKYMISAGGSYGHYFNEVRYNPHSGDCGSTAYDALVYENYSTVGSAGYYVTNQNGYKRLDYGVALNTGSIREYSDLFGNTRLLLEVNPSVYWSRRWLGIGGGLHIGSSWYLPTDNTNTTHQPPAMNHEFFPVLPSGILRIGPYDIFDLAIKYNYGFPSPLPWQGLDVSWGSGLGMKNGSGLRVGTNLPLENFYVEGSFLFSGKYGIKLQYAGGKNYFYQSSADNIFSIGFSYLPGGE